MTENEIPEEGVDYEEVASLPNGRKDPITINPKGFQVLVEFARNTHYPYEKIDEAMKKILKVYLKPPTELSSRSRQNGFPYIYYNELFRHCDGVKRGTFAAAVALLERRGVLEGKDDRFKVGSNPVKPVTFLTIAPRFQGIVRKFGKYFV